MKEKSQTKMLINYMHEEKNRNNQAKFNTQYGNKLSEVDAICTDHTAD